MATGVLVGCASTLAVSVAELCTQPPEDGNRRDEETHAQILKSRVFITSSFYAGRSGIACRCLL